MKKWLVCLTLAVSVAALFPNAAMAESNSSPSPSILLDGLPLSFPVPPQIIQDRTMIPFRAIAEALGVEVTWHSDDMSIGALGLGRDVRLQIDSKTMWVDGFPYQLDVPPQIVSDRTLIPLRAFTTAFGAQVGWNPDTNTVSLTSPKRPMETLAFYAIRSYGERAYVAQFSDVAYGWSTLTADGRVDLASSDLPYRWPAPDGDVTGERLLEEAAQARTRRYLMVWRTDVDGALTSLVLDSDRIEQAATDISAVAAAKGFDGVVLDLEGLGLTEEGDALTAVRTGFSHLVAAVSAKLKAEGRETVVAVHPPNGAYHGYDYAALGHTADRLVVMAYDYRQDGQPEPADQVEAAIQLSLNDVDRSKLLLGISTASETAETLPQKIGLAKRYSLAGVALWRLGLMGPDRMTALEASVSPLK
jgi:hypothetical protein